MPPFLGYVNPCISVSFRGCIPWKFSSLTASRNCFPFFCIEFHWFLSISISMEPFHQGQRRFWAVTLQACVYYIKGKNCFQESLFVLCAVFYLLNSEGLRYECPFCWGGWCLLYITCFLGGLKMMVSSSRFFVMFNGGFVIADLLAHSGFYSRGWLRFGSGCPGAYKMQCHFREGFGSTWRIILV